MHFHQQPMDLPLELSVLAKKVGQIGAGVLSVSPQVLAGWGEPA